MASDEQRQRGAYRDWILLVVLGVLVLQVATTATLVVAGAAIVGQYAERLNDVGRDVDQLKEFWYVDTRNLMRKIDQLEMQNATEERQSRGDGE